MICSLTGAVASEIVSNSMQIIDESKLPNAVMFRYNGKSSFDC